MKYLVGDLDWNINELKKIVDDDKVRLTLQSFQGDLLAASVFLKKYALCDNNEQILEWTLQEAQERWARTQSEIEKKHFPKYAKNITYYKELFDYLVPAGRIMYGLGNTFTPHLSLSNCYYLGFEDDSLESIFNTMRDMAKTYSWGGGVGVDIGKLRPRNSRVNNSAKYSTGAVSFMDLINMTTGVIGQHGRRGACLVSIPINHPDIEGFIDIKNTDDLDKVRYCNISVKTIDEFMEAVEKDDPFLLSFTTKHETIEKLVPARKLWDKIIEGAWKRAEPGLIFWSHVQKMSPSEIYPALRVAGTNPCGEQILADGDACLLSSLVLNRFVKNPFTTNAQINYPLFIDITTRAVRHLDNIIEEGQHPLEKQKEIALLGRRVGLGITGLADMLAALGIRYDSQEALEVIEKLMKTKRDTEYQASIELAEERGPFPLFDHRKHFTQPYTSTLPKEIKERGRRSGLRNVSISTVPPVGSGSIIYQCSSGIEPIFRREMVRSVNLGQKDKQQSFTVLHPSIIDWKLINTSPFKKEDIFIQSNEIDYKKRVELQGIIQKYVDSSISSTINIPKETSKETVGEIYQYAYKKGLKGITVYREGSREGVLRDTKKETPSIDHNTVDTKTYKFIAEGGDKFYVHISYRDQDTMKPYQIFITNYKQTTQDNLGKLVKDMTDYFKQCHCVDQNKVEQQISRARINVHKLARLISLGMKINVLDNIMDIIDQHAIAGSLAFHLNKILRPSISNITTMDCPDCGAVLVSEGGCWICKEGCGYSKCS